MNKAALGDVDEFAAIDDLARRAQDDGTTLGRLRTLRIERGKIADERAGGVAIVLDAGFRERRMQFGDMALTQDAGDFAAQQNAKRENSECQQGNADPAQGERTCEQIVDQRVEPQAERQGDEAGDGGAEHATPGQEPARDDAARLRIFGDGVFRFRRRRLQFVSVGLLLDGGVRRRGGAVRIEAESAGAAGGGVLGHGL